MSLPRWEHSLSGCNYRKHEVEEVGFFFFFFITLPKQIPLAFYVAGLKTCHADMLNVKRQSEAVEGEREGGCTRGGAGSIVGHRLDAMILCNPSLLHRQHPETHVWCVNDAACENGSGRPCDLGAGARRLAADGTLRPRSQLISSPQLGLAFPPLADLNLFQWTQHAVT